MAEQSTPSGSSSSATPAKAAPSAPARQTPGATMADVATEPQPVPTEGSTVIHPPLIQNAPPPSEPDKSTAEDHEKANSKTEGKPEVEQRGVGTITVESALDDDRVALYERDPAHPNGEAFVGPDHQVEVARTGAVEARLAAGILREAGSK